MDVDGLIDALVLERDTLVELLDEALATIAALRLANDELYNAFLTTNTTGYTMRDNETPC